MSAGEGGFLSRWSRLKREEAGQRRDEAAARVPAEPPVVVESAGQADIPAPQTPSLEDLIESLPKVEDLVAGQDLSAFMQAWVPAELRHAALRRMWLVDPAIRDYVSPALDYAYDYNNPASIAGFGPMQTTAEQIREVMAMFDRAAGEGGPRDPDNPATKVEEAASAAPGTTHETVIGTPADGASQGADPAPAAAVRADIAGFSGQAGGQGAAAPGSQLRDGAAREKTPDGSGASGRRRRHGSALPG